MQLQFLTDTYQFETEATVVDSGEDEDGSYVVTNASVFYPGGGGQEPDRGKIILASGETYPILDAFFVDGEFRQYLSQTLPLDTAVKVSINPEYRIHNAQLHTAGHLLSSVLYEKLSCSLRPIKGFHYQQGAYMEFEPEAEMVEEPSKEDVQNAVEEDIRQNLLIEVSHSPSVASEEAILQIDSFHPLQKAPERWVRIQGYQPLPCGGTHVHHTGEIENFSIRQIQYKKGRFRITYRVGD